MPVLKNIAAIARGMSITFPGLMPTRPALNTISASASFFSTCTR